MGASGPKAAAKSLRYRSTAESDRMGAVAVRHDSSAYIFGDTIGDEVADRLLAAVRATLDGLDRTAQSAMFDRHVSARRLDGARQLLINRGRIAVKRRTVVTRSLGPGLVIN